MENLELKTQLEGIKSDIIERIGKGDTRHVELQRQVDAIDMSLRDGQRHGGGGEHSKSPGDIFTSSEQFLEMKAAGFSQLRPNSRITVKVGQIFPETKSTITTTSGITAGVSGITMPMRLPGVRGLAQQALRIRDLMPVRKMDTGNSFDFVQQLTRTNNASPQVETSPKGESTYTWNSISDTVKTIAHFVNVSRQAIDDVPWLTNVLNSELTYGLKLKEETEILSGDGLGQHMNGLVKQATPYDTSKNVAGDTKIDKLRHAILQARLAGLATFAPDGIVLNPTDWAAIELIKDEAGGANKGRYVVGDPEGGMDTVESLWELPIVESDSIAPGTFLVGSFSTAAEVVDRMETIVELGYQHNDNFTRNIVTLLCECRTGLAVTRPSAFIYGSF